MASVHDTWCKSLSPDGGKCNCSYKYLNEQREDAWERKELPARVRTGYEPVMVSAAAENKVADLEQAMQRLLIAETHPEKAKAYADLGGARRALYLHIESLEQTAGIRRTVKKRF